MIMEDKNRLMPQMVRRVFPMKGFSFVMKAKLSEKSFLRIADRLVSAGCFS